MIYIATSVDKTYFNTKHQMWCDSVAENNKIGKNIMFQVGFKTDYDNIISVNVDYKKCRFSSRNNLTNRKNYVCLESGEFINFYDFNDDDVLILTDYDIVMQRLFNDNEIEILNNLPNDKFALNLDCYDGSTLHNLNYLGINNFLNDVDPSWKIYNAGVQAAKISAWKILFNEWVKLSDYIFEKCTHHAAGQLLFNYIVQKNNMVYEMPASFHNANWFNGSLSNIKNGRLVIKDNIVLFNHHKWLHTPLYKN
jgi:hypothetical protein